jgi:hypothetical protein
MFFNFNVDVEYVFSKTLIFSKYFSIYYWNIIFPLVVTIFFILLYIEYSKRKMILYNIQNDVFVFKSIINDSIKEIKTDISKLRKQIEVDAKFNAHQLNLIESKILKNKNDKLDITKIVENYYIETKRNIIERFDECFKNFDKELELLKNINIEKDLMIDSLNENFKKINTNFNKIENQCSGHTSNTITNTKKICEIEETIKELIYRINVLACMSNGNGCLKQFRQYRNVNKNLHDSSYDILREKFKRATDINFNIEGEYERLC